MASSSGVPGYDPAAYPPFAVTADLVVFTVADDELCVVTVERGGDPFRGRLALPGGFVHLDEDLRRAAHRELAEETGLGPGDVDLTQLGAYGAPDRDPRMRVVSVAWVALTARLPDPVGGSDAATAQLTPVDRVLGAGAREELAFDHARILADGLDRVRHRLETEPVAAAFCGPEFTVLDLRRVYETVWGTRLDARNFHRKVLSVPGLLEAVPGATASTGGRRAQVYRLGPTREIQPPLRPA